MLTESIERNNQKAHCLLWICYPFWPSGPMRCGFWGNLEQYILRPAKEVQHIFPGGYSQKNWVGLCGPLPKILTQYDQNLRFSLSPTLFMTWPKRQHPLHDCCGWHSCPKYNLWRAFDDGIVDNDEKIGSSKKQTQFKIRVKKNIPCLRPKWPKSIPYLWTKRLKNYTLCGRTYRYSPY